MADFFNKVKKGFNKGTTVISVKSSTMMETNKLKSEISSLKKEKTELFTTIGERFYNMKKEGQVNYTELENTLARAFEIDQTIEQREQAIEEAIRKQEETIKSLGEEADDSDDKLICSCGETVPIGTKFCNKCGKKMEQVQENLEEEEIHEVKTTEVETAEVETKDVSEQIICECGAQLPSGTVFCVQCGRKVN